MIITLTGTNNFMLQNELKKRVNEFLKENGDMALERIDCEDTEYEVISGSLQSMPFLAPKKLIVLRHPGAHKKFSEELTDLVETIPDSTDVIIVEPKPDKRSVYYKTLKKITEFKEFVPLESNQLANWLVNEANSRGGSLSPSDCRYLIERVGDDQQLLNNELDKLLAYDPKITRQIIDILTEPAPQGTVFQLLDAAFAGNTKKVLELYDGQRAQKVEPLAILAMLAWQLHVLSIVKTAGERTPPEIAKEAGLNPFVVQKTAGIARRISLADVKRLVSDLQKLDVKMKSTSIDADEALKFYLMKLAEN